MKRDLVLSEGLLKVKMEEMEILWQKYFLDTPPREKEEIWTWCERLPKFEGVGRTSSHPKYKNVK